LKKAVHSIETSGISNPAILRNKTEELNPEHPVVIILLLSYFTAVHLTHQALLIRYSAKAF
jgi:hypothetical protein